MNQALQRFPVMETFYTIQGEGRHTGSPAYFIRLGGCDVGCTWCDVKESWDASAHPQRSVDELTKEVVESGAPIAVITGGEPAMHDLNSLTRALQASGVRTHIETSGVHPLSGEWNWITFSPKKFKAADASIFHQADELKVIVYHSSDISWAQEFADRMRPETILYLQPEWSRKEMNTALIIDYIRKNPRWKISVQTHKYIGVE